MRYIRHLVIGVLMVLLILVTPELYKNYVTDLSSFDRVLLKNVRNDSDLGTRIEIIDRSLNEIHYCIVNQTVGEKNTMEMEFFCSDEECRRILEEEYHRKGGSYHGIITSDVSIAYTIGVEKYVGAVHNVDVGHIILCSLPTSEKGLEILQDDLIPGEHGINILRILDGIWLVGAVFIMLLAVVEAYLDSKKLFLEVTLGYPKWSMVCRKCLRELSLFLLSIGIPAFLLNHYLLLSLVDWKHLTPFILFMFLDILILNGFVLRMNLKRSLGRDVYGGMILRLAYITRVLITAVSVTLVGVLIGQSGKYIHMLSLNRFMEDYRGYAWIQTDKDIVTEYYEQLMILYGWCYLKDKRVYLANYRAGSVLKSYLGDTFQEDGPVTVYVPIGYMETLGESESEDIRKNIYPRMGGTGDVVIREYEPKGRFGFLENMTETENSISLFKLYHINYYDDPVFVYSSASEPAELLLDADDGYIYDPNGDYRSLPYFEDVYTLYEESARLLRQQCMIWIMTVVVSFILQWSVNVLILKIEHSLNSMQLCIRKITGMPLIQRYEQLFAQVVIAYFLGMVISAVLLYELGGTWAMVLVEVVTVGFGTFFLDLFLTALEIAKWEKTNEIKILKGGAL